MILDVDGLTHDYGSERAVTDVSVGLDDGELVGVLGPSGCGKTTLVQAIAGHIAPTAGRVRLRGTDVTEMAPENRGVGVVFQQSTLFPHMTVSENIAYGLAARDIDLSRRTEIVREYLELVELADQREAYPDALSGGQQRRAELARALAPEPDVLVLDEPLSSLDRALRTQLRDEIARIQRETGVTTLFVTHDQKDAMTLADRLVILQNGSVSALGEPRALYESPPNQFVASFLGRSNLLPAEAVPDDLTRLNGDGHAPPDSARSADSEYLAHVRPEDVVISPQTDSTALELSGRVSAVTDSGRRYDVRVELASGEALLVETRHAPPAVDGAVAVGIAPDDVTLFARGQS